jgi:GNAT superfamily N-acetyltransferase
MTVAIHRLGDGARATVTSHFLALPMKDRRLRFGTTLAPRVIAAYVDRIDFDRDAVFGVHDDRLMLVGVAHVAFENNVAELGLSVLPAHRGLGLGVALFKRALAHARNRCIPRLFMHYVYGNAPIMRIARRFGMDIVAAGAGDADAHLDLPPASLTSMAEELATDTFAWHDHALKRLVAAWKQRRDTGTRI